MFSSTDSPNAALGATVMAIQVAITVAITVIVVRKANSELERSLSADNGAPSNKASTQIDKIMVELEDARATAAESDGPAAVMSPTKII